MITAPCRFKLWTAVGMLTMEFQKFQLALNIVFFRKTMAPFGQWDGISMDSLEMDLMAVDPTKTFLSRQKALLAVMFLTSLMSVQVPIIQ